MEIVSEGRGQGFGLHVPIGEENVPKLQAIVNDPEGEYPLLQMGVQD